MLKHYSKLKHTYILFKAVSETTMLKTQLEVLSAIAVFWYLVTQIFALANCDDGNGHTLFWCEHVACSKRSAASCCLVQLRLRWQRSHADCPCVLCRLLNRWTQGALFTHTTCFFSVSVFGSSQFSLTSVCLTHAAVPTPYFNRLYQVYEKCALSLIYETLHANKIKMFLKALTEDKNEIERVLNIIVHFNIWWFSS